MPNRRNIKWYQNESNYVHVPFPFENRYCVFYSVCTYIYNDIRVLTYISARQTHERVKKYSDMWAQVLISSKKNCESYCGFLRSEWIEKYLRYSRYKLQTRENNIKLPL